MQGFVHSRNGGDTASMPGEVALALYHLGCGGCHAGRATAADWGAAAADKRRVARGPAPGCRGAWARITTCIDRLRHLRAPAREARRGSATRPATVRRPGDRHRARSAGGCRLLGSEGSEAPAGRLRAPGRHGAAGRPPGQGRRGSLEQVEAARPAADVLQDARTRDAVCRTFEEKSTSNQR